MGSGGREPGHRRAGRSAGAWEGDGQAGQLLQCPPRASRLDGRMDAGEEADFSQEEEGKAENGM